MDIPDFVWLTISFIIAMVFGYTVGKSILRMRSKNSSIPRMPLGTRTATGWELIVSNPNEVPSVESIAAYILGRGVEYNGKYYVGDEFEFKSGGKVIFERTL